jgi:hypothetical protein
MTKFRKRPVEVDAWLFRDPCDFSGRPEWFGEAAHAGKIVFCSTHIQVVTDEGLMTAKPGDWIIRGVEGEIYPCRASVFEKTYEPVGVPSAAPKRRARAG